MKGLEFSTAGSRNSMPEPLADFLYVHFSITVYLQLHPLTYTDAYCRHAPIMPHLGSVFFLLAKFRQKANFLPLAYFWRNLDPNNIFLSPIIHPF
jgi:hypothetical protein